MDATNDIKPLVEDLQDSIEELETALAPLLRTNHSDITSKLPLLDKAKVSVLITYAIESILFSVLRLNGVDAKSHPIFTELARVKQYFEKIKDAENGGPATRANLRLNAPAANRFIKAALAGNDRFDKQWAEVQAAKKLGALTKLDHMDVTPVTSSKTPSKKRKADTNLDPGSSTKSRRTDALVGGEVGEERGEAEDEHGSSPLAANHDPTANDAEAAANRELKKAKKERKREKENEGHGLGMRPSKHNASKKSKSSKPPRDTKTVFKDLLNG